MTEEDYQKEQEYIRRQSEYIMIDWEKMFEQQDVCFRVYGKPPSLQNNQEKKLKFTKIVQSYTKQCPYIITNTCWIHIDYYCSELRRFKNPNMYDMDNIIKPILDALVGRDGLVVDDVLFDRVEVNWIDKNGLDEVEIRIEYPELHYQRKEDLSFFKNGLWCFPRIKMSNDIYENLVKRYFSIWNRINEDNCDDLMYLLPKQVFIAYNKIQNKNFDFIDIDVPSEEDTLKNERLL